MCLHFQAVITNVGFLDTRTFFARSHASLRPHRSCCKVSAYPRILEHEDYAREVHTADAMDHFFPEILRGEAYNRLGFRRLYILEYATRLLRTCQ